MSFWADAAKASAPYLAAYGMQYLRGKPKYYVPSLFEAIGGRKRRRLGLRGPYSGGPGRGIRRSRRRVPAKGRRRRKSKKFVRRKRRQRRWAKRVGKVAWSQHPTALILKRSQYFLEGDADETKYKGFDVGINPISGGTPHYLPVASDTTDFLHGDLGAMAEAADVFAGTATTQGNYRVYIKTRPTLLVTMRNNSNFGIFVRILYLKRRYSVRADAIDTVEEIFDDDYDTSTQTINHRPVTYLANPLTQVDSDTQRLLRSFRITSQKLIRVYPGQIKQFKLQSPLIGMHTTDLLLNRTNNPRYNRSMMLMMTGFPIHDTTATSGDSNLTVTAPIKVDFVTEYIASVRRESKSSRSIQQFTSTALGTLNNFEGQPIVGQNEGAPN